MASRSPAPAPARDTPPRWASSRPASSSATSGPRAGTVWTTCELTIDRYTHPRQADLSEAIAVLPDLSRTSEIAAAAATGTTEKSLSPSLSPGHGSRQKSVERSGVKTDVQRRVANNESLGKSRAISLIPGE